MPALCRASTQASLLSVEQHSALLILTPTLELSDLPGSQHVTGVEQARAPEASGPEACAHSLVSLFLAPGLISVP